jgi:hypothetical protein
MPHIHERECFVSLEVSFTFTLPYGLCVSEFLLNNFCAEQPRETPSICACMQPPGMYMEMESVVEMPLFAAGKTVSL